MTRKDYELLSESIRLFAARMDTYFAVDNSPDKLDPFKAGVYQGINGVTREIALQLAEHNKAFDPDRFINACGVASAISE